MINKNKKRSDLSHRLSLGLLIETGGNEYRTGKCAPPASSPTGGSRGLAGVAVVEEMVGTDLALSARRLRA